MYTRRYEEPERVEYVQDALTGKAMKIDQCYVGAYESNRPRRTAASRIDSCDCKALPATREAKRISSLKQKKPKMNMFHKIYLFIIGVILLTERPQVNFEGLNRKLVY